NILGRFHYQCGERAKAADKWESARRIAENLVNKAPSRSESRSLLAQVCYNLGYLAMEAKQHREARRLFEQAVQQLKEGAPGQNEDAHVNRLLQYSGDLARELAAEGDCQAMEKLAADLTVRYK